MFTARRRRRRRRIFISLSKSYQAVFLLMLSLVFGLPIYLSYTNLLDFSAGVNFWRNRIKTSLFRIRRDDEIVVINADGIWVAWRSKNHQSPLLLGHLLIKFIRKIRHFCCFCDLDKLLCSNCSIQIFKYAFMTICIGKYSKLELHLLSWKDTGNLFLQMDYMHMPQGRSFLCSFTTL